MSPESHGNAQDPSVTNLEKKLSGEKFRATEHLRIRLRPSRTDVLVRRWQEGMCTGQRHLRSQKEVAHQEERPPRKELYWHLVSDL